jgi:hypothetical protein
MTETEQGPVPDPQDPGPTAPGTDDPIDTRLIPERIRLVDLTALGPPPTADPPDFIREVRRRMEEDEAFYRRAVDFGVTTAARPRGRPPVIRWGPDTPRWGPDDDVRGVAREGFPTPPMVEEVHMAADEVHLPELPDGEARDLIQRLREDLIAGQGGQQRNTTREETRSPTNMIPTLTKKVTQLQSEQAAFEEFFSDIFYGAVTEEGETEIMDKLLELIKTPEMLVSPEGTQMLSHFRSVRYGNAEINEMLATLMTALAALNRLLDKLREAISKEKNTDDLAELVGLSTLKDLIK